MYPYVQSSCKDHACWVSDCGHWSQTDHASDVWVIGKPEPPSYDGMVTNREGLVIAAPGADCMPLLFTDPVAKVIGVAHAGKALHSLTTDKIDIIPRSVHTPRRNLH